MSHIAPLPLVSAADSMPASVQNIKGPSCVVCSCIAYGPHLHARYREIAGFEGVLAGCLVALKQIMPDNEVVILKLIRFRVKVGSHC